MTTRNDMNCEECGARHTGEGDCCAARFGNLLALDHSHVEPWGSRHGQAFAAFALQHPKTYASSLDRAWAALYRIYMVGDEPGYVFRELVAHQGGLPPNWDMPPRPAQRSAFPRITIADLGDFEATTYPQRLDEWCRASLVAWGARAEEFVGGPDGNRAR